MKEDDRDGIQELLSGKRYGYVTSESEEVKSVAREYGLAVDAFPSYAMPQIVIAVQKRVHEVVEKKLLDIGIPALLGLATQLYETIKDFPVTKALIYLQGIIDVPQTDILYGLLFGYKPCDIKYYVETRDLGIPKHSLESAVDAIFIDRERVLAEQHVMCEECSRKFLETEASA